MESQAAALRDVVERQGGEVAALRAAAAAAEAESMAAKTELAQVRKDFFRKSQEMHKETLSTILADYGDGPATSIAAAYHPAPIHRVELQLPPTAAMLRQSVQARAAGLGSGSTDAVAAAGLAGGTSAVELLESLLQQGRQQQQQAGLLGSSSCAAEADGAGVSNPTWGIDGGRASSLPAAVSGVGPSWLNSMAVGNFNKIRNSMLVAESTFIFPSGLAAPEPVLDEDGNLVAAEGPDAGSGQGNSFPGLEGSSWTLLQQQPQPCFHRQTSSAPGSSYAGRAGEGRQQ